MKNLIKTLVLSICIFCYNISQAQSLYGTYTIGTGGNYTSIAAAMTALTTYGVSGDVTFNILSGTYSSASIDYANGIPNLGTYDTITFTSITNNASQVTFSSTITALTINNAKNLVIKNITCNASSGEKGINITGNCENVEIQNCIIRSTSNTYSSTSHAGIYYQRNYAQSALSDNIRIFNNTITGGYYGVYFYGYGYSNYATNVIIDNNQISESYRYAIYSSYANFNSISKNFILGNSTTSTSLYGLYLNYCNSDKINENTVRILSSSITAPYGMCFQNLNYRNTNTACLISNNEIIMSTSSTNYGMLASYSRANIIHNSILVLGTGQSRALQLDVAAGYPVNIRNNNFHNFASAAYPIYIPSASMTFLGTYLTMDYNNYYNQSYIGYAGSNVSSINDWQTFTGQDAHSISLFPNYPNIASFSLETDPNQLICPRNTAVNKDIRDTIRKAITSMGAYHSYIPPTYDIKIQSLLSPSKDVVVGSTVPIRISIMNMGKTPIDSIDIYFTVNGTNQVFYWRGTALNLGDTTSNITLGHFTPHAGENDILIYTKLCNGHIDSIPENDTVKLQAFGCKSSISNTYTVGSSGADFTTINEALDVLSYCGILVPTTISILPGTYNENIIINTIKGLSETNTLTITSSNGDSSSVIIQSLTTNPTLTLSNAKNSIIKKLTIKAYSSGTNSIAIKLQNSNKNISILNNYITTSTATPSTSSPTEIMAIYSSSSLDTNLTISNNYIKGSGGIYIVSGGITASTYNVNILNNNITEIHIYGIYSSYSRIAKIKNNRIIQNSLASIFGGTSYGLQVYYSYGVSNTLTEISNNYIKGSFETFANLYYCINVDNYYSDVLFTNNSFIKTGSGTTSDMLYINYGQWQIINNTFVNIGDGSVTDMVHIASSSSTNINFSNNILTSLKGICTQLINWNVSFGTYTLDYNDYYTINGNIAYHSTSYATLGAWQSAQPSYNIHSKNVNPIYVDSMNYTKPTNWPPLMCSRNNYATQDIEGNIRAKNTYMGCYEPLFLNDAGLIEFISPTTYSTAGDTTKIIVKLFNYGTNLLNTITFEYSVNGVLQTPITISNLNLSKHKDTNITVGFFIPVLYVNSVIKVWCKNPNSTTDQNLFNDTISTTTSGCSLVLNGEYIIGNNVSADFQTISDAITALNNCGVSGPVVFKLLSGTYSGFSISSYFYGTNETNTITFRSAANHADSVIIQSSSTALSLGNAYHLCFYQLTFDASSGTKGIDFSDTCYNILIKKCIIKANPTSTSNNNVCINKGTNTYGISNIKIIDNMLNGGYYGIYFYGGYGKNIKIDSNTISNAYSNAIYFNYNNHINSISYNIITSRTISAGSTFNGIYCGYYVDIDTIQSNKIDGTKSSSTTSSSGIYCNYINYNTSTPVTVQIINNEIILQNNANAIYLNYYARANVCHNSIYITGNIGSANGIYLYYPMSNYHVSATNNNIINLSTGTNPTAFKIFYDLDQSGFTTDYNNYYTINPIIIASGTSSTYFTLSQWQNTSGKDANSSNILPTFINISIDLRIDGTQLLCPRSESVLYDRYGIKRKAITNKGAYHNYVPVAFDITPQTIISPTADVSNYISIPVILTVMNKGDSAITSFDIHWSVNDVDQTTYHWTGGPLEMGNTTSPILINYYTPVLGYNTFKFYTTLPNGHNDQMPSNDTISIRSFACGSELSGIYTVGGKSADFDSLNTALRSLYACGLAGNVVFNINSGTYIQDIDLSTAFMDVSSSYTVTFTSSAKNADSVSIVSTGTILNLANVKNLTFSHLTFDARSGINAITFNNNCNSIDIYNCKILMNPISTNSANIGIYKPNNTGTIDMISIKNNYIDGGYCGINFYGGYYSSNYFYGTNIVIDSNIITNAYYYGLQTYYTSFTSISYNQIISRASNSHTNFHGMYLNYSNANIIGNRISNPTAISQPYGMHFSYINYMNTTESAVIANNEIITNASNSAYGIYFDSYYYRANIINNSILCKGGLSASSNRAIYITYFTSSSCLLTVKNNLLVNQTYGYPIYFNQTPPASVLTIDYNNYYAPTYIGYYNTSISSLSAWKTATGQDTYSVNVNPSFKNTNINLDLTHSNGLRCLKNTLVQTDINNISRKNNTTIGAYEVIFDLEITKLNKPTHTSSFCSQENTDVEVVITNLNQTSIDLSIEPIYLHVRISGAINYQKDTIISFGSISGLEKDTFTIIQNLTLTDTGIYNIKTYLNNIDNNVNNDTLNTYIYVNPIYFHYDTLTICDSDLPFTYGDSIFPTGTASGTYPVHYTLSTGCDSLITLTLIVNPTYHHYKTVSICDNELPYTYGDSIFPIGTASGTYPVHYTLPTGCDSLITLTLIVNPTYHHYKTVTICDNELPYTYGDSIFPIGTASGTYPVHYTLPTGCDSLITLTLNVNPTYHHYDTITICDNDLPITYGDSSFAVGTKTGNYPVHHTLSTGCDSLITLSLIVNPTYHHYKTVSICNNELPYTYGDSIFPIGTTSGTYPVHYTLPTGCDSLITLTLIVNPIYHHYKTVTICDNELPYTYGDSIFPIGTASGTYPVHYTLPTGCDSLITLTLNVNPTYHHYDTITICDNDLPITYGDSSFVVGTKTGNYPVHFTLPTGCDSLITLSLIVNPTYHHYKTVSICDIELPYTYGDSIFPIGITSGTYPIHYTLPTGCDSLISLTLIVNPTYHHYKTVTICDNELPYTYGDSIFPIGTASGTYPVHYTLPTGCDSLITLTLNVNPTYHNYDTITICDNDLPITYGDSSFAVGTKTGNYPVHYTLSTGCDSLITLSLIVNPTYHHYKTVSICDNELPYTYGDSVFPIGTTSGTYPVHYTLPTGCDSLITLSLIVNPTYHHYKTVTICDNELPYSYGDSIFPIGTASGTYPVHYTLSTGCDSLITLTLNVNPTYHNYDTITICDNDLPITYGDSSFAVGTKTGNYPVHYTLSTGCDSLITLSLIVNPTYHHYKTVSICDNELPYTYGDSIFPIGTASGTYPVHYTLSTGCDSLISLNLIVNPTYHHYKTVTICDNELPYSYGDSIFPIGTASGTYPVHYTLSTGCDSLITLTLNVNPTYHNYDTITICDNDLPITYGDSSFAVGTKTGNYPVHYTLSTGCDSLITLSLIVNPTYHHYKTVSICDNELPYTYGDSIFPIGTASGTYPVHYTLSTGCDSLISLTLIVNPTYYHYKTVTICDNELPYTYIDTIVLDTAGIYTITFTSVNGCDSLISLTLNVNPTYHHYDTITICDNELPYTYGDSIFPIGTTSGTYPVYYTLATGCDSLISLNLIMSPTYHYFDTITICANDLPITYGDSVFGLGTTSGNYPIHYTLPTGCDSLITLTLIVNPTYHHYKTVSICDNELPYTYGDSIFPIGSISGNYNIHYTLTTGCDSLITLNLIVNPTYSLQDTLSICSNDLPLTYGDSIFPTGTLSGNYPIHFTLPTGCDSLVTLNLIVNPVYNYYDTLVICNRDLPYSYGDSILNTAGNYSIEFTSIKGCDSIIYLTLLVYSCDGTETVNICDSDLPYNFHDSIFYNAGIYYTRLTSHLGLDSIVVLVLKVHTSYTVFDTVSICSNELPLIYGDSIFVSAGNHYISRTSIFGCDSSIRLTLIVNPVFNQYDTISICDSDLPLIYGDSTFFASGNYNVHFLSSTNCDSIINLTLNVYPSSNNNDTISICDNQLPFNYGDSLFPIGTISGNYPILYKSVFGCDSLITLTLIVNPTYYLLDTITICKNDLPFIYGDSLFSQETITGDYPIHFTLPSGCDSLINLHLIINPIYNHYDTLSLCANDFPFSYGDSLFPIGTISGDYIIHFTLPSGCDSLIMLHLKVFPTFNHFDTLTIRNIDLPITYGDSLFPIGTVSGDYAIIFKSINGCDSTINLHLTVNISSFASDTLSICDSELPITYGDSIFPVGTTTGFYQIVFSLPSGGDSTVTLLLFVHNTYNLFDTLSICDSELPFLYGDSIFPIATTSGDYPVLFTSYFGCDSLINLHLNVNPTFVIYDTLSICENELPYTYADTTFNAGTISGTYNFYHQSIYGCDSITLLALTVNPAYNFTDTHTLCESELPFIYAGQTFDSAGNYSIKLLSQFGCDSNIFLTIYVFPSYKENRFLKICDSELPYFYAGYRLDLGGTYNLILKNNNGCDSLITLFLAVKTIPFQPDAIIGNPFINHQGQYTFSVNPIDNATSYRWYISNPEWRGSSTTNVISIFIPNPGYGTIAISAINECGESDKSELYLSSSIGIKDYDPEQKFTLYPNPAVSFFYIDFNEIKGDANIQITDVNGKILHNMRYNISEIDHTLKLDISKYPKGFYFISINNNNQTVVKKLIIE